MKKAMTKKERVLMDFLSGKLHTRFSAERELHDHCLHSTVASLQRDEGIKISRMFIDVPGFQGEKTRCCLYWMDEEEIERYRRRKE